MYVVSVFLLGTASQYVVAFSAAMETPNEVGVLETR